MLSVREQLEARREEKLRVEMAETVEALAICCEKTQAKVDRIRQAIQKAKLNHKKFSVHALKLYLKTTDAAYEEFNALQNRIYMTAPAKKDEYEPMFIAFEELYEFTRIGLCEMLQKYEDEEKVAQNTALKPVVNCQHGDGSASVPISFPPTLVLQQAALPSFDGRYENWFKFKQMFCDIAEKCTADSAATKLHYLDKALVGKAQGAIDQQIIRDNDYAAAWASLTQQFENLPALVNDTISRLLNVKPMVSESYVQLKTLLDDVEKSVNSLEYHELKMDKLSEAIITNLTASKLDMATRKIWESSVVRDKLPEYKKMMQVLRNQQAVLERCERAKPAQKPKISNPTVRTSTPPTKAHTATVGKNETCALCNADHLLEKCEAFLKLDVNARYGKAKQYGLCFHCLKRGHRTAACKQTEKCSECSRNHHTLMHPDSKKEPEKLKTETSAAGTSGSSATVTKDGSTSTNCTLYCNTNETPKQVLLATAVVNVTDACGVQHKCRALLDSGAMANFMSQSFADLLNLKKKPANVPVVGVNGMETVVKFKVEAKVESRTTAYSFSLDYLVVPKVTGTLPVDKVDVERWPIPRDVALADETFNEPNRIDLLIGAEVFFELLQSGKLMMSAELPILQESVLGWLVSGRIAEAGTTGMVRVCHALATQTPEAELAGLLRQFWSVDEQEFPASSPETTDACEKHFLETHSRNESGRYVVRLPFRSNVAELGSSREQAEKRFFALERRLDKNPKLKEQYKLFIDEYISLGHARVVDDAKKDANYLPHHCVLKPDSSTTKLRVVFDASAKSTTGLSLNDVMLTGPTVQSTLFDIVLRFRCHKYVFTADVPKMYRQVEVHEEDRKYQMILWRDDRQQPLRTIELSTVTYGTAAAPYLATRALNQLALDEQDDFPQASKTVLSSFYVDDVLAGANNLDEAQMLQKDMIEMLARGGFQLHKWCANHPKLLEKIPVGNRSKMLNFENDGGEVVKTLGLLWDPVSDVFKFSVKPFKKSTERPTKRQIMSDIARLFDPLGYLGPAVMLAKLVMQRLWRDKIPWDDPVDEDVAKDWERFRSELCGISDLKIPRVVTAADVTSYELHGFADASMKGYGCSVYLRSLKRDGTAEMMLLSAKSRVAPLKELDRQPKDEENPEELTIPRLELCAGKLLVEQVVKVRDALELDISRIVLWTDSQIVLDWIKRLKPDTSVFVRNRIAAILKLSKDFEWRHIPTAMNPADLISRGVYPLKLIECELWWHGPEFLHTTIAAFPFPDVAIAEAGPDGDQAEIPVPEIQVLAVTTDANENPPMTVINDCSDYRKLQRIFGYVTRFLYNCRHKPEERQRLHLKIGELRNAQLLMVRVVQHAVYGEEISCIRKNQPVKGKLRNLNPMFDETERVLRVGGRIRHSDLPRDQKHPLILPERHHLTVILIDTLHLENLHVGRNGLLAVMRRGFWPVNGKRTIARVLKKCVKCFRVKPSDVPQFMGDLPSCRVTEALPFSRTGVDYAGPLLLKQGRMRSPVKAYIALFVCMTTKALHLELVSSLSTDAFLGALHRFVGRRGNVSVMRSDRGTNFVGGDRQLKEFYELLKTQLLERKLADFCQVRGIDWRFNPPKAPHQGGLWEAGVKSVKYHLNRILKEAYLTYEEMNTLLVQIEAILNSRPLCQQSDDPCDYQALTPGHFLVGRELTAVAEPLYEGLRENTLSRYQLVQKRKQDFWRRWSRDYVTELQKRGKWDKTPGAVRNGMLVMLKEDNTPPQSWRLGRIVETHPGGDGVVRVVTVRTSNGATFRRPTTQIAILPILDNEKEEN